MQRDGRDPIDSALGRAETAGAGAREASAAHGFGVVGCRALLPDALVRLATQVTPRAFAAWCDGSTPVVVFGDEAFRDLDPVEVKRLVTENGMTAILYPIDSGFSDFVRWARDEVGLIAAPGELPGMLRAALAAA